MAARAWRFENVQPRVLIVAKRHDLAGKGFCEPAKASVCYEPVCLQPLVCAQASPERLEEVRKLRLPGQLQTVGYHWISVNYSWTVVMLMGVVGQEAR